MYQIYWTAFCSLLGKEINPIYPYLGANFGSTRHHYDAVLHHLR